jgi:uncharacterized protein involved in exopolysaccharide biosynthesis
MTVDQKDTQQSAPQYYQEEESIDLIAIAKTLWIGRKTILISIGICTVIGLLVAFNAPKVYTSRTVMVPQLGSGNKTSGLSSLASMAGIDLGSMNQSSTDLSPLIYPQIVNSIPFKLELMNTPIHFEECDTAISIYEYYTNYKKPSAISLIKKYTIGLPGVILSAIRKEPESKVVPIKSKDRPIQLTRKQASVKKMLDNQVSLMVEKKEGYVTLSASMPEPLAAAEIAQKAQIMLQNFITRFKVEKSQAELNFIQERYNIAKAQAEGYQYNVAASSDKYKDLVSNVPQVSNTRLQTKYNLANSVYLELAKQLEQAKLQVKKDTPVFTIVEPASIPTQRTGSGKAKSLAIWMFLGFLIGSGLVYGKKWYIGIKDKWETI